MLAVSRIHVKKLPLLTEEFPVRGLFRNTAEGLFLISLACCLEGAWQQCCRACNGRGCDGACTDEEMDLLHGVHQIREMLLQAVAELASESAAESAPHSEPAQLPECAPGMLRFAAHLGLALAALNLIPKPHDTSVSMRHRSVQVTSLTVHPPRLIAHPPLPTAHLSFDIPV